MNNNVSRRNIYISNSETTNRSTLVNPFVHFIFHGSGFIRIEKQLDGNR